MELVRAKARGVRQAWSKRSRASGYSAGLSPHMYVCLSQRNTLGLCVVGDERLYHHIVAAEQSSLEGLADAWSRREPTRAVS